MAPNALVTSGRLRSTPARQSPLAGPMCRPGIRAKSLRVSADHRARPDPALLDLPWSTPLEDWDAAIPGRSAPRHLPARRPVRAGCPAGSSRSRRSRRRSPGRSTSCCASLRRLEHAARRALRRDQRPDDPRRGAAGRVPAHPPPEVLAALPRAVQPARCARTRPAASSTPSPCCSCGCTSPGSGGATCRCRTPCSAATPGAFAAYLVDAETGELLPAPQRRASASTTSRSPGSTSPASSWTSRPAGRLEEDPDPVAIGGADRVALRAAVGRADRPSSGSRPATAGGSTSGSAASTTSASTSTSCRCRRT